MIYCPVCGTVPDRCVPEDHPLGECSCKRFFLETFLVAGRFHARFSSSPGNPGRCWCVDLCQDGVRADSPHGARTTVPEGDVGHVVSDALQAAVVDEVLES
jgi:hypothetical protein